MFYRLLLLFTVVPFIELTILLEVGQYIGVSSTLLIIILTGVIGAALARMQGFSVLQRIRQDMQMGRIPTDALIDGLFILSAALLLVTPGFLTDLIGFFLLAPFGRQFLRRRVREYIQNKIVMNQSTFTSQNFSSDDDYTIQ